MKRWKLVLPSLVACFSLPLVSLAGCYQDRQTKFFVTLYADSGTFGDTKEIFLTNVSINTPLKDIPGYKRPTNSDFLFWMNGNTKFDEDAPVKSNLFLKAHYYSSEEIHLITLFANGGTFEGKTADVIQCQVRGDNTKLKDVIGDIVPTKGTIIFRNWLDGRGNEVDMQTYVTHDFSLKANYWDHPNVITLYANGGRFESTNETSLVIKVSSDTTKLCDVEGYEVPVGDSDFKNWVDDKGKIIYQDDVVTSDLFLKANYAGDAPLAYSFTTDPWSTVCYYANQGIEKLHEAYRNECNTNPNLKGTLIGLERNVVINGLNHTVVVVDETKDDYLDNDGLRQKAALTFQFKNLICNADGTPIKTAWDAASNADYWKSKLCNLLNDQIDPTLTSVYEMIKQGPNDTLAENIKSTYRVVNAMVGSSWQTTEEVTLLFEPLICNLFSPFGIANAAEHLIPDQYEKLYCADQQYTYYCLENPIGKENYYIRDHVVDGSTNFGCLVRKEVSYVSLPHTYWLTSPHLDDNRSSWCVYEDGSIHFDYVLPEYEDHGLAPCFCV